MKRVFFCYDTEKVQNEILGNFLPVIPQIITDYLRNDVFLIAAERPAMEDDFVGHLVRSHTLAILFQPFIEFLLRYVAGFLK